MKRRSLAGAGLAGLAAAAMPAPAVARGKRQLKMVTAWPCREWPWRSRRTNRGVTQAKGHYA